MVDDGIKKRIPNHNKIYNIPTTHGKEYNKLVTHDNALHVSNNSYQSKKMLITLDKYYHKIKFDHKDLW